MKKVFLPLLVITMAALLRYENEKKDAGREQFAKYVYKK